MNSRALVLVFILLVATVLAVSCGSGNGANDGGISGAQNADEPLIVRTDQIFTPESFTEMGWKKSKQYDIATVPNSTEIWYGFFKQKDIEIRFYETHDAAVEFGIPSAETAIEVAVGRSQGGRLLDFSGGSFSAYAAYVVIGNTIVMCEIERSNCDALIAQIP
ncbi:MAG: hypothetical protein O3B95_12130 [Chloroflexi bacterium]|nr:hypothetical protein [Chloroflexota bacterium]